MPDPRTPQDHKSKSKKKVDAPERFSFEHDGETYTFPSATLDVLTPGFIRKNRRRDETDYFMTIVEALCGQDPDAKDRGLSKEQIDEGEDILDVIDGLPWKAHQRIQQELQDHIGASLGE